MLILAFIDIIQKSYNNDDLVSFFEQEMFRATLTVTLKPLTNSK